MIQNCRYYKKSSCFALPKLSKSEYQVRLFAFYQQYCSRYSGALKWHYLWSTFACLCKAMISSSAIREKSSGKQKIDGCGILLHLGSNSTGISLQEPKNVSGSKLCHHSQSYNKIISGHRPRLPDHLCHIPHRRVRDW